MNEMNNYLISLVYQYLQLFEARKGASKEAEDRESEKLKAEFEDMEVRG
jgi:hypothetical protein